MSAVLRFIITVVSLVALLYFISNANMGSGSSVSMESDRTSATMTTTDMFGNKSVCKTYMVGNGEFARVFTTCN